MTRKVYTMTQEQFDTLLEAMKPVPLIMLQCGMPPSQQERANAAWMRLGEEMGFDGMSAKPEGNDPKMFSAEPIETKGDEE